MTNIEWTSETWNPIVGCLKISAGCANCYAAEAAKSPRLQQFPQYQAVSQWDGTTQFVGSQLRKPLSWRSPKKVFVCSMSDLFHENNPFKWIDKVFAIMALAKQHTFQVLTKRPHRMVEYFSHSHRNTIIDYQAYEILRAGRSPYYREHEVVRLPLPNVWVGVTAETQEMANQRIPLLLQIPAAVRFLSCEPLLESLNLNNFLGEQGIHWLIVGGESGGKARKCELSWIGSIVEQCKAAGTAVFVKQLGSRAISQNSRLKLRDRKGGQISEFPEDLRIREFPKV